MANFKKDETAIKQNTFNFAKISETGSYKGFFSKAYKRMAAASNAEAIHFDFMSPGGTASFDIWHTGKNGDKLERGHEQIQELMSVIGIDDLREKKNDTIEKYDFDLRAVKDVRVDSYPALINVNVGCVFQMEEYIKQENVNGEWVDSNPPIIKERPVFIKFFNAEYGQSAYEVENGLDADSIENYVTKLAPIKKVKVSETVREDSRIIEKATAEFDIF